MAKKLAGVLVATLTCAGIVPALTFAAGTPGDINSSGQTDREDVFMMQDYMLGKNDSTGDVIKNTADMDSNGKINIADLSMLKSNVLNPSEQPTTKPSPKPTVQPTSEPTGQPQGGHTDPSAYMAKVRESYVNEIPADIQNAKGGELKHVTYFSKKANKEKPANVWTPPGYDPSNKYPVFYVNHGIQGNEFTMLGDFKILESAAGLIEKGEAEPMIIVFTQMYTNPNKDGCDGITSDEVPYYDAFLDDLTESLMPYIESNYSCKTGRENTAIGGFSMGGRESLYIGIMRPDLFGYIAATSPAPGVVPARDHFMEHVGSITEDQFKMSEPYLPYLLMIAGGTADGMVGDFPEQYHKLFERNNTDHIWISVPGGGHDGGVGAPLFYNFIKALFKA